MKIYIVILLYFVLKIGLQLIFVNPVILSIICCNLARTDLMSKLNIDLVISNFRTILLSVISLLNEPNICSPANIDASIMYRRWRDSKGKDAEYENIIRYRHVYLFEMLLFVFV